MKTKRKVIRRFSDPDLPPDVPTHPPVACQLITGDPILPPELEREIFELVAAYDLSLDPLTHRRVGDTVLALPLVCRRVQNWIEPMIYERVSFLWASNGGECAPRFLETISARPASFFATHLKHLYFDYGTLALSGIKQVLGVCTGVVSGGCHHRYSRLEHLLAPLPLQRLLLSDFPLPSAPGNSPRWAASLTHLGIVDTLPRDPAAFATLPSRTSPSAAGPSVSSTSTQCSRDCFECVKACAASC
ncbi:hypothetical protein DFH06DRAFT_769497 [Mycena polygramma]|nr:hypothetical protein DFH06DRAFT_769497 [Mycena polygramma]